MGVSQGAKGAQQLLELLGPIICAGLDRTQADQAIKIAKSACLDDWLKMCRQAKSNGVAGIVFAALRKMKDLSEELVPEEVFRDLSYLQKDISLQYFCILSFTTYTLELLRQENISVYVLKGLTLNALYPDESIRPVSDVDLYLPDGVQFRRACAILEDDGYQSECSEWDYHKEYRKLLGGRQMILELHIRPAGRMAPNYSAEVRAANLFLDLEKPELYRCAAGILPGLPAEYFALHLLIHMMNHFAMGEFKLLLLCDWTMFWRARSEAINPERFAEMLEACGLSGFAHLITGVCIRYLKLPDMCVTWMSDTDRVEINEQLLYDRFLTGTKHIAERRRVKAFLDTKQPRSVALALEVHRQMRYRFPKAGRIVPFWPALWAATITIFLKNNRRLGRGSVRVIIAEAAERTRLLEELSLIERGS